MFENHSKSRILHCERSELPLHFESTKQKYIENAKIDPFWRVFENLKLPVKQCYSVPRQVTYIGQKLVKNAKIEKFKCDILSNFQTL